MSCTPCPARYHLYRRAIESIFARTCCGTKTIASVFHYLRPGERARVRKKTSITTTEESEGNTEVVVARQAHTDPAAMAEYWFKRVEAESRKRSALVSNAIINRVLDETFNNRY